jgi:hypothetical protein
MASDALFRDGIKPCCRIILACLLHWPWSTADSQIRLQAAPDAPFSFAVIGDNRGDPDGSQHAVFLQIIRTIDEMGVDLVFNTGDVIDGYSAEREDALLRQWRAYQQAIASLHVPLFHAPGNHDIFDTLSARVWRSLWGPTYYSVDYGNSRFVVLDTETERGRIGGKQFEWLRRQLREARNRNVFVFLHRPLFPVDGHIGSSLDQFPAERNRLHRLFVQHRRSIKAVFAGHEHLYNHQQRDGIDYYITAGGGAFLYEPRELGGFYHFLLVKVKGQNVDVKLWRPDAHWRNKHVVTIQPGSLLESWESSLFWYTWDQSVSAEITAGVATRGNRGLKLCFNMAYYKWPVLYTPFSSPVSLLGVESLRVDVFVRSDKLTNVAITPVIISQREYRGPSVPLRNGWNTARTLLDESWLPKDAKRAVEQINWVISSNDTTLSECLIFDDFRASGESAIFPGLQEDWEYDLLWGVSDEYVRRESNSEWVTEGKRGLKIEFDFAKSKKVVLYAGMNSSWDICRVKGLTVDVYAPVGVANSVEINLTLRHAGREYRIPTSKLRVGWNTLQFSLYEKWLPAKVQESVEHIRFEISSKRKDLSGWVVFDNLRSDSLWTK